ncbi:RNA polymerase sigma factor [Luteimonas sp. RIT-PG2_3]
MNRIAGDDWPDPIGSPEDTAGIVARYEPAIRRYFARRLPTSADVDDFTQELFTRLLRREEHAAIGNGEGYLFRIAANMMLEHARREARHRTDARDPSDHAFEHGRDERSPERVALGEEAFARAIQALQALPERSRTVFLLNRYEGLSGTEIARRLGISVSAVEKHMMRAITQLQASAT